MLLTFKRKINFPSGEWITDFDQKILEGIKPHSIRRAGRWEPGMSMHLWSGSPRSPKSNPKRIDITLNGAAFWVPKGHTNIFSKKQMIEAGFSSGDFMSEYDFLPVCYATEAIQLYNMQEKFDRKRAVRIGGRPLSDPEVEKLAINDGFESVDQFFEWFKMPFRLGAEFGKLAGSLIKYPNDWAGEIVHWTKEALYTPETAEIFEP